uniref:Uncharacterized protein n=1 Tax=Myoviridae sp. ctbwh6 TaxID=2827611 RepID=A0A8S5LI51_9CAUD|nr:MAG TPA: hypothetical protein [Myoviridae sp. ctbwh6]
MHGWTINTAYRGHPTRTGRRWLPGKRTGIRSMTGWSLPTNPAGGRSDTNDL